MSDRQPQRVPEGYRPKAYEKSVVLGGGLVLDPIANPPDVAATMHVYAQRLTQTAYEMGRKDALASIRKALEL